MRLSHFAHLVLRVEGKVLHRVVRDGHVLPYKQNLLPTFCMYHLSKSHPVPHRHYNMSVVWVVCYLVCLQVPPVSAASQVKRGTQYAQVCKPCFSW